MLQETCELTVAILQEYTIDAGSQLVAVFEDRDDVSAVREFVDKLLLATLGTPSNVDVEVCLGCVVVYITFRYGGLSGCDELAQHLKAVGAELTFALDKESHTGFLACKDLPGALVIRVLSNIIVSLLSLMFIY